MREDRSCYSCCVLKSTRNAEQRGIYAGYHTVGTTRAKAEDKDRHDTQEGEHCSMGADELKQVLVASLTSAPAIGSMLEGIVSGGPTPRARKATEATYWPAICLMLTCRETEGATSLLPGRMGNGVGTAMQGGQSRAVFAHSRYCTMLDARSPWVATSGAGKFPRRCRGTPCASLGDLARRAVAYELSPAHGYSH